MSRLRALAVFFGISFLWGSQWLLGPTIAAGAQPFTAGAFLFGIAALAAFAASLVWKTPRTPAPPGAALLLGLTLLAGPEMLLILAGKHGAGGWTPLLYSLMPLMLALPSGAWIPAMAAAPACVLVLLNGSVPFSAVKFGWAGCALAAVLLQAGALSFLFRRCRGRAVRLLLAQSCAFAALALGLAGFLLEHAPRFTPSGAAWAAASLAGVCGTALPYAGLLFLLQRGAYTPAQAAAGQWLQTLFAVGESAVLVRAHVPASVFLAAAILLVCAWSVFGSMSRGTDARNSILHSRS